MFKLLRAIAQIYIELNTCRVQRNRLPLLVLTKITIKTKYRFKNTCSEQTHPPRPLKTIRLSILLFITFVSFHAPTLMIMNKGTKKYYNNT